MTPTHHLPKAGAARHLSLIRPEYPSGGIELPLYTISSVQLSGGALAAAVRALLAWHAGDPSRDRAAMLVLASVVDA